VVAPPPRKQAESGKAAAERRGRKPSGDLPGSETGIREWRWSVLAL